MKKEQVDYIYDGTFNGLLTCVYHHYYTAPAAGIFTEENYQMNMLNPSLQIETDEVKSSRVYDAVVEKISERDMMIVYKIYLSCAPDKEMAALRYIVMGFHEGKRVSSLRGDEVVHRALTIARNVGNEAHRFKELVRFNFLEGDVAFSTIEPDNDILELIAEHFSDRFNTMPFVIMDKGRHKALISYDGRWAVRQIEEKDIPRESSEDEMYRSMWKDYYNHIAIKERTNYRCQRGMMPKKYWKHLTEKQL